MEILEGQTLTKLTFILCDNTSMLTAGTHGTSARFSNRTWLSVKHALSFTKPKQLKIVSQLFTLIYLLFKSEHHI